MNVENTCLNEIYNNHSDFNGYEVRCKLCNSKFLGQVQEMREKGKTYEDIKDYLESNGEKISVMSISRHFTKHHPLKQAYLDNISKIKTEELKKEEKILTETVKMYPYLMTFLCPELYLTEGGEEDFREIFLHNHGYCTTGHKFCENVPQQKVYSVEDVIFDIDLFLESGISPHHPEFQILISKKLSCVNCRSFYTEAMFEFFYHYLVKNALKLNLDIDEVKRIFLKDCYCDCNEMESYLRKFIEKND